jgi:hypothetical protein
VILSASVEACVVYEYEHEFWLNTDGSGTVSVIGRPDLWAAFKKLEPSKAEACNVDKATVQRLFERSGLKVRRVKRAYRAGQAYLSVAADFADVNRLGGGPAFPDLDLALREEGDRLLFSGTWRLPNGADVERIKAKDGLMAVRFHLPSKVYEHKNAFAGVQRGNIVGWRQALSAAIAGHPLEIGVVMDRRSILSTTIYVFIGAVIAATALLSLVLFVVFREGRRRFLLQTSEPDRADINRRERADRPASEGQNDS